MDSQPWTAGQHSMGGWTVTSASGRTIAANLFEAEAHLIVAAADLLVALRGLASYAYAISNPNLLPHDYEAAVKALRKAEGNTTQ